MDGGDAPWRVVDWRDGMTMIATGAPPAEERIAFGGRRGGKKSEWAGIGRL